MEGNNANANNTNTNNTNNQNTNNGQQNQNQNNQPTEHEKEVQRLMTENSDLRNKFKGAETELGQIRQELTDLKKAGHKNSGDWQKLAEANEAEANTWKEKFETSNKAFVNTLKTAKIREEAVKMGIKTDMLDVLEVMELDGVQAIIDERNQFRVTGLETSLSNLKKLHPSMFNDGKPPAFNSGTPNNSSTNNSGKMTLAEAKQNYVNARANQFKDPAAFKAAILKLEEVAKESRRAH